MVFNKNCYYIKETKHTGQEIKITLNSGDTIKYNKGNIELSKSLQQTPYDVQSGTEKIPYYIGGKTLYANAKTQIELIQSYRNNRLRLNKQEILQAPLVKILEHNHEQTLFVGGLYQYIGADGHPVACLKELFVLDISQYPQTIFYTGKNNRLSEKCLEIEMELELLKDKAKINMSDLGNFVYSKGQLKSAQTFSFLGKALSGNYLTIQKKQLPYIMPLAEVKLYMSNDRIGDLQRTFSLGLYDKGKAESNARENVYTDVDQVKVTEESRIRFTRIYAALFNKLFYEREPYLGYPFRNYGIEDSLHFYLPNISEHTWYYNNRKILLGNYYMDFYYNGRENDLFVFNGEFNKDKNLSLEEKFEFKNYIIVDKVNGKHVLYKFGLKDTINSGKIFDVVDGVFKASFIDGSEMEYNNGQVTIVKNPNNNLIVEEHSLPYKIEAKEQYTTPLGALVAINSVDQHDILLESKKILSGNYVKILNNNTNNTIFIGSNDFHYSSFLPYEKCSKQLFLIDVSQKEPKLFKFGNDKICNALESVNYLENKVEINIKNNIKLLYQGQKLQISVGEKFYQFDANDELAFDMFLSKVTTEEEYKKLLQTKFPIYIKEEKIPLLYDE